MEKARMMLNSIISEPDKVGKTMLIKYYISEYRATNPIFLAQLFKLILKYIYENEDFELFEVIFENFSQELGVYGYESQEELNNLISYLIQGNYLEMIKKTLQVIPRIGNQRTLTLLKELIQNLEKSKYIDTKLLYDLKKSTFDLKTNIENAKKSLHLLNIIEPESTVRWKKFEEEVNE